MRIRAIGGVALVGCGLAGVGCSLINTDDLPYHGQAILLGGDGGTRDASFPSDGDDTTSAGSVADGASPDGGPPPVVCANDGGTPGVLNDTNNCGVCGHLCGTSVADTATSTNYCVAGTCEGVQLAVAGEGRQVVQFSNYGLVWSTVTLSSTQSTGQCAVVVPTVYGIASSSSSGDSLFMVSQSTGAAYYAAGLVSDIHGITYQNTDPTSGENVREVGFGTMKIAGNLTDKIFGLAEPPQETVLYFFSEEASSRGPHEWTTSGVGFDGTGSIPLDVTAPEPTWSPYNTAAMAADATWLYYGEKDGVYRIRGGAVCTPTADAGAGSDAGSSSSCEGLFLPITSADGGSIFVTSLAVDDQYLFVATSDGQLVRYQTIDGGSPLLLSTAGPFYGLTQDVAFSGSTVQFGTRLFATSTAGPILEMDKGGKGTVQVATSPMTPMGVVVDSAGVYWVEDGTQNTSQHCPNGDGRVMRVSRPPTEP